MKGLFTECRGLDRGASMGKYVNAAIGILLVWRKELVSAVPGRVINFAPREKSDDGKNVFRGRDCRAVEWFSFTCLRDFEKDFSRVCVSALTRNACGWGERISEEMKTLFESRIFRIYGVVVFFTFLQNYTLGAIWASYLFSLLNNSYFKNFLQNLYI